MATYTCSTTPVAAGQSVTVTKKSGQTKDETIDRVVWSGNGVYLCSIATQQSGRSVARRGVCEHCGDACNPRYRTCFECSHGGQSFYDRNGHFVLGSDD